MLVFALNKKHTQSPSERFSPGVKCRSACSAANFSTLVKYAHRGAIAHQNMDEDIIMKTTTLRPYLKLIAIAEDEATKEFFAIIKCRDLDGGMRSVTLPLADLNNRKALAKTLTNLGAYFSNMESKNKRALDELLASKRKAERFNFAARVGWYGSGYKAYVLAKQVIGAANSAVAIRPPQQLKSDRLSTGIRPRGEHAEWLSTVASHAKFSSRRFSASARLWLRRC
jgi:Domain of unknown function (DUF927)